MNKKQPTIKRISVGAWILGLLVLAVGIGFGAWKFGWVKLDTFTSTATSVLTGYQTSSARIGEISVSINGTGKVVTSNSVDLGFTASGTVGQLNVAVGDKVSAGQVLAVLDNLDALQAAVQTQTLAVEKAQKALDNLVNGGAAAIAQAEVDLASAQSNLVTAQANLRYKGQGRCTTDVTNKYYTQYIYTQKQVDEWEKALRDANTGYSHDYILQNLTPLRRQRDLALYNLNYCQLFTDQEIQASQANLQSAQAALQQAQTTLADLKANNGVDPDTLTVDKAALENAQRQLTEAQKELAGATISAPMDGTIMKVNGSVGSSVGTGTFITLADLTQPIVQVNIDESDLENFSVGCPATITFDSLSGVTYSGKVTEINPMMVSVQSVSMAQGLVDLEESTPSAQRSLPLNTTANVEITCHQASNILVIPAQGLYTKDGVNYYVYTLDAAGQPQKLTVEIGMQTAALAEVKSGLNEGDKIVISQIEK